MTSSKHQIAPIETIADKYLLIFMQCTVCRDVYLGIPIILSWILWRSYRFCQASAYWLGHIGWISICDKSTNTVVDVDSPSERLAGTIGCSFCLLICTHLDRNNYDRLLNFYRYIVILKRSLPDYFANNSIADRSCILQRSPSDGRSGRMLKYQMSPIANL